MKRFDKLDLLPEGQDMVAGIDMTNGFGRLFQVSAPSPGCIFSVVHERELPCENPSDAL